MATIQELIASVQEIKSSSEDLSVMVSTAGNTLGVQANQIASLTRPSQSGQQASIAVSAAAQSVLKAAAIMKTLCRTCDNYLNNAVK